MLDLNRQVTPTCPTCPTQDAMAADGGESVFHPLANGLPELCQAGQQRERIAVFEQAPPDGTSDGNDKN